MDKLSLWMTLLLLSNRGKFEIYLNSSLFPQFELPPLFLELAGVKESVS